MQKVRHEVGHRFVGDVTTQNDMSTDNPATSTSSVREHFFYIF